MDSVAITESVAKSARAQAFAMFPNVGTWTIAFHRRVACILEVLEKTGVQIDPYMFEFARCLAGTSFEPEAVFHALQRVVGGNSPPEEMFLLLETWASAQD